MGVVRCQKCFLDVSDYVFDSELRPICTKCSGHHKIMEELVKIKEEDYKLWVDSGQFNLNRWL